MRRAAFAASLLLSSIYSAQLRAEDVGLSPEDVIQGATTYAPASVGSPGAVSPASSTASSDEIPEVSASKQQVLSEMWERRILDPGVDTWTAEDKDILDRIKEAENVGALDMIRDQVGHLRGFVVVKRDEHGLRDMLLTKAGFYEYMFLKSQMARKYFEDQGTDAKFVFQIRTSEGKRIFDGRGVLTSEGDYLYNKILRGMIVEWKESNGNPKTNAPHRP